MLLRPFKIQLNNEQVLKRFLNFNSSTKCDKSINMEATEKAPSGLVTNSSLQHEGNVYTRHNARLVNKLNNLSDSNHPNKCTNSSKNKYFFIISSTYSTKITSEYARSWIICVQEMEGFLDFPYIQTLLNKPTHFDSNNISIPTSIS